ncbi:MAG TPA: hypothetical protein DEZ08_07770 [Dehalococcoidia bacterium]|nr:hypothetical protein [Dehalococcoidia bacterium]|tara:strand:+ start:200 stop:916 length:717 start_codon:yes stop_codon:yes gene_type:complete
MSKITDFLDKISDAAPTPIGFGATRGEKHPGLGLVVSLAKPNQDQIKKMSTVCDGFIFKAPPSKSVSDKLTNPWILDGAIPTENLKTLLEIGCDSICCDLTSSATTIAEDNLGVFLKLNINIDWQQLTIINTLPVDGYIIEFNDISNQINLDQLSKIGLITHGTDKYCLLTVSSAPAAKELEALRKIGVIGIIMNGDNSDFSDVKQLKDELLAMPSPNHKKKDNPHLKSSGSVFELEG